MTAARSIFVCQTCGTQAQKWHGRCPGCGEWNSMVEEAVQPAAGASDAAGRPQRAVSEAKLLADVTLSEANRLATGMDEFDRVLGGGIVPGSLVLLGGEPGIGKSTLLLQAAARTARRAGAVLYASGEESEHQIKARGNRMGVGDVPLYLLAETCLERILEAVDRIKPALLVIDSIQTVFSLQLPAVAGSIGQVREAATHLLFTAKDRNVPIFLVGHVTKEGALAGPRALEHIVDTVLYFEGERHHSHRIVRAVKNRFGAVSELGLFDMQDDGLHAVPNPSRLFLSERAQHSVGSAVLCALEGSRPLLLEVQALVGGGQLGAARRMASGIDRGRLSLLLAVLDRRAGLSVDAADVFVNIAGGLVVSEPAADLAVAAAVASSLRDQPVRPETVVFGEIGLAGEVRAVPQAGLRVKEASQLGFARCVLPVGCDVRVDGAGCERMGVATVEDALAVLLDDR